MRYRSYATRDRDGPFVHCNRTRTGWECLGPRGRSWEEDKDDAIREYFSLPMGPILIPETVVWGPPVFNPLLPPPVVPVLPPPILGRPFIRGGRRQDIDIEVTNEYNIKGGSDMPATMTSPPPQTVPTSGGRDVPTPADPTPTAAVPVDDSPSMSANMSMEGMPSWLLPVGALGLVLVLVLVMKK